MYNNMYEVDYFWMIEYDFFSRWLADHLWPAKAKRLFLFRRSSARGGAPAPTVSKEVARRFSTAATGL